MRHWLPVAAMAMPSHSQAGRRGKQPGTIRFLAQLYCPITECAEMRAENNPMANSTTGRTKCHKKRLSTYLDLCCARPICQHVRWVTLASSSLKSCGKVNCTAPPDATQRCLEICSLLDSVPQRTLLKGSAHKRLKSRNTVPDHKVTEELAFAFLHNVLIEHELGSPDEGRCRSSCKFYFDTIHGVQERFKKINVLKRI